MSEPSKLERLYASLQRLEDGGVSAPFAELKAASLPKMGLYFFFEPGEMRHAQQRHRVVRVGTHGVSLGSKSSLRQRLRTHRGAGIAGSHRSSVFRLHVGAAMLSRDKKWTIPSWGIGSNAGPEVREGEKELEEEVTVYMHSLRISWLGILDDPGPLSDRAVLEKGLIGLLSNGCRPFDEPSAGWLGRHSPTSEIRDSGLWNIRSTRDECAEGVLDLLEIYVEATLGITPTPNISLSSRYINDCQRKLNFENP